MLFYKVAINLLILIFSFIIEFEYLVNYLYYLQLNSYNISSVLVLFCKGFWHKLIYILLCEIISIFVLVIGYYEFTFAYLFFIIFAIVFCSIGDKFCSISKIKFTKRLFRLLIFELVLFVLFACMFNLFGCYYLYCFLYPINVALIFFRVVLVYLILMPIEKIIGNYYIRCSKKKLTRYRNIIKIGITGSFGKTSVKEILTTILSESNSVLATPKSYNTPFGISKTINNYLSSTNEVFICEMGAKKCGEIKYLCEMVDVDYGIVTSVGRQHIKTFGSIDNVYKTKKELPDYLHNKCCVFNLMNNFTNDMYKEFIGNSIGVFVCYLRNLKSKRKLKRLNLLLYKCNKILSNNCLYEYCRLNNYYAKNIVMNSCGTSFDIYYSGLFLFKAKCELIGLHNIINILLSVALAKTLGESDDNIELGISKIKQIKARLEKIITPNGAIVLNNGYNSNIDSAKFTISTLNLFKQYNKVLITPGVVETDDDFMYNRYLGKIIANGCCDEVVIVKKKNRDALTLGLNENGFNMNKVYFVDAFKQAEEIINKADGKYVFLIENDLPDNYL